MSISCSALYNICRENGPVLFRISRLLSLVSCLPSASFNINYMLLHHHHHYRRLTPFQFSRRTRNRAERAHIRCNRFLRFDFRYFIACVRIFHFGDRFILKFRSSSMRNMRRASAAQFRQLPFCLCDKLTLFLYLHRLYVLG